MAKCKISVKKFKYKKIWQLLKIKYSKVYLRKKTNENIKTNRKVLGSREKITNGISQTTNKVLFLL